MKTITTCALLLAACAADVPTSDQSVKSSERSADARELATSSEGLSDQCFGDLSCPARFADCEPAYDFDCGEPFCRTPGVQCSAKPSTFIRVEHAYYCYDRDGNLCVAYEQGRRLLSCGC